MKRDFSWYQTRESCRTRGSGAGARPTTSLGSAVWWGGPPGPRATPWSPCARPWVLTGLLHQPRPYRIFLNVVPYLLELPLMPHRVVVALFLPKRATCQSQHRVGPFGCDAFQ